MKNIFYSHLINIDEFKNILLTHELNLDEIDESLVIIQETIHYRVVNEILTSLPEKDHQWFLKKYNNRPYKKSFLKELEIKIENLEKKIKKIFQAVKKEIILELKKKN